MLVYVHSADGVPRQVDVTLQVPDGLHADTATRHVSLEPFGDAHLYFRVRGVLAAGRHEIKASASLRENAAVRTFAPRLRAGRVLAHPAASLLPQLDGHRCRRSNVTYANLKVGYIKGVGDNVMSMLEELGIPVAELDPLTLPQIRALGGYTAIVVGPRAYEANPALVANNGALMAYARNGGTIVTQYGQGAYGRPGILPFPLTAPRTADRVTDENASVRVLDPGSPLLATPEQDRPGGFRELGAGARAVHAAHVRPGVSHRVLDERQGRSAAGRGGARRAGGQGNVRLHDVRVLPRAAGRQSGCGALFVNLLSATPAAANRPPHPPSEPVRP